MDLRRLPGASSPPEDRGVDEDARELISRLYMEAGAIMEDTSVLAIRRLPKDPEAQRDVIVAVRVAAADILALSAAADVIARRQVGIG